MFRSTLRKVSAKSCASATLAFALPLLGFASLLFPGTAQALECGSNNGYTCTGAATQYAGGFNPGVGSGGFGGGGFRSGGGGNFGGGGASGGW